VNRGVLKVLANSPDACDSDSNSIAIVVLKSIHDSEEFVSPKGATSLRGVEKMQLPNNDPEFAACDLALRKGQLPIARSLAENGVRDSEKCEDWKRAGIWYRGLAYYYRIQGKYSDSVNMARRAANIQPDEYQRALSLQMLAPCVILQEPDPAVAANALNMAEEACRAFPRDVYLSSCFLESKAFYSLLVLGDVERAVCYWQEGVAVLRRDSLTCYGADLVASNLSNLAFDLATLQGPRQAEEQLLKAFDLLRVAPDLPVLANAYDSLGFAYMLMGKLSPAESLFIKSVRIFRWLGHDPSVCDTLLHQSELYDRLRKPRLARLHAERALEIATDVNLRRLIVQARDRMSSIETLVRSFLPQPQRFHDLVYSSSAMKSVVANLKIVAPTNETVLILGDTGTGKELVARAVHAESARRNSQFVAFNCSTLSRDLIESRLFGHRKGAFTSAHSDHIGVVRSAERGTLFLDEIGDLSLEAQGALLRFLQSGEVQPVGAVRAIKVDTRVIAATNRNLAEEVEAGRFRLDLFYRLNTVTLSLPPLWMRREDIPVLACHFAKRVAAQYGKPEPEIDRQEMTRLMEHDWPGNVRELESYIRRRVLFGMTEIEPPELMFPSNGSKSSAAFGRFETVDAEPILDMLNRDWEGVAGEWASPLESLSSTISESIFEAEPGIRAFDSVPWRSLSPFEKRHRLEEALARSRGNITRAAELLGITRRTIQRFRSSARSRQAKAGD
jgi:transcriptional regulator with GAF, ATPase, and Fis domain